jgi:eukaryotic-like serine/threonine-protein kinase
VTACIEDNTVVEFIEGKLSAAMAAMVEQHMARCESCRMRVMALGTSPSMIVNAPTAPAGVGAHLQLAPGTRVGRFTVLHEIGRGGIGVVFAAYDPQLERNVALKFLQSASQKVERVVRAHKDLLAEGRAMARLAHSSIITIHEVGTFQGEAFIVMELIHGVTLSDWLQRWTTRPWTSIIEILRQAGQALAHAHAQGLAHGDFKPENVLLDDSDRVKVMDFGLSRLLDGRDSGDREDGAPPLMGTPRYMAPEQFQGRPSDPLSDQFSFCVALYEALYGQHPFAYDTPLSLLKLPPEEAIRPVPPRPDVPAWLGRALQKGLQCDAKQRYTSMDELLAALAPPVRRRRGRGLAAAAAAALVVCFFGYALGAWHGSAGATLPGLGRAERALAPFRSSGTRVGERGRGEDIVERLVADVDELKIRQDLNDLRIAELEDHLELDDEARLPAGPQGALRRSKGLSRAQVKTGLQQRWRDLEVCFREWRERQPRGRHVLAIEARIGTSGLARVTKLRGLSDKVVKQCVSGAIEAARFPRADGPSVVKMGLHSKGDSLHMVRLRSAGAIVTSR